MPPLPLPMSDFRLCKLCAQSTAVPTYRLTAATVYVCRRCDFHAIDSLDPAAADTPPPPLDRRQLAFIEERLAASAGRQQRQLDLVRSHLPLAGADCLDLGAGAGYFAHLLHTAGARVRAIEPQATLRCFARGRFALELRPETIDAPCWQQECAATFDLVTLWDVLEHLNAPAETLRDAAKVLRPGGWLFLDTPRRDAFWYRLGEWAYRCSGGNPVLLDPFYSPLPYRHKQILTRRQLHALAERCGLQVLRLASSWRTLHGQMTLICRKITAPF